MKIINRSRNVSIPLFVAGIAITANSCTQQERPEGPKSAVNNSAVRDLVTNGSNMFLDYVRKTGSTEVISKSIALTTPFVTNLASTDWKTDAELLAQTPDPSVNPSPGKKTSENETPSVTCSSWFDSFLRGDQASITVKEPGGEKNYLLQFKLCESPEKGEVKSATGFLVSFLQKCANLLMKEKTETWTMYRTPPMETHALITSRPHLQECTAWSRNIGHRNLMGVRVDFSYTRECRLRCDPTPQAPLLKIKGKSCIARRVEWSEFAEFPDAELAAETKKQGAASCDLEPSKP
jgi:hypothetical protein